MKRERWTGSGLYGALDNFGRVVEDTWVKDLGTDRAIYDVDLVYDRNSNIVRLDDHVHPTKFDAVYTMDNLDRLVDVQEGDLNGGSTIATEARQQTWTLEQTGNWELEKLDLNGDGDWGDADEHQDDRTHNAVNELTARDIDDNGSNNYTLTYDETGNLIDDGEAYKYEYDCFYRLRKIYDQTDDLVAEYRYNGLGYRIAEHIDMNGNGTVDGSDAWRHFAHDERWRVVATFIDDGADPEVQHLHHAAGSDGQGRSSYIDEVLLRDWDSDSNGSLNERHYYLQSSYYDLVAIVGGAGKQTEMVRYGAYGSPFGLPRGDVDSNGAVNASDLAQIQAWIDAPAYDVRGDLDLDGDVDSFDKTLASALPAGDATLGRNALSGSISNRNGFRGYQRDAHGGLYAVRTRSLSPALGRWLGRDYLEYEDSASLLEYAMSCPVSLVDPFGLSVSTDGEFDGDEEFAKCKKWAEEKEQKCLNSAEFVKTIWQRENARHGVGGEDNLTKQNHKDHAEHIKNCRKMGSGLMAECRKAARKRARARENENPGPEPGDLPIVPCSLPKPSWVDRCVQGAKGFARGAARFGRGAVNVGGVAIRACGSILVMPTAWVYGTDWSQQCDDPPWISDRPEFAPVIPGPQ